jgi:DegV family protein with EDD domain
MDRISIVTDSVSCIPHELAEKYGIHIIPAGNIYFNGKIYRDWVDLSHEEAYRMLDTNPKEFYTGPTTPADFLETFKGLSQKADTIIYIALSSKFSTLYNMARTARDMAKDSLPGTRIEVLDSETATAAQGFIALAAAREAHNSKSLDAVLNVAERVKKKVDLYYILHTVRYVYRTGRVPKSIAKLGSGLNLQPIVTVANGSARIQGVVRNKQKGMQHLLKLVQQKINTQPAHIAILHADAPKEAEELERRISDECNCVELWSYQFSPLMVYATGRGVLGLAFYAENSLTKGESTTRLASTRCS